MLVFLIVVSLFFLISSIAYATSEYTELNRELFVRSFLIFLLFGFLAGLKYEDEEAHRAKAQVVR